MCENCGDFNFIEKCCEKPKTGDLRGCCERGQTSGSCYMGRLFLAITAVPVPTFGRILVDTLSNLYSYSVLFSWSLHFLQCLVQDAGRPMYRIVFYSGSKLKVMNRANT